MKPLFIERKMNSPLVDFNAESGLLQILGRSIPEHPVKFYQPIEDWLNNFIKTSPQKINFTIYLDYMNTHSTECMLILLKRIENYIIDNPQANVLVKWKFDEEDEDMEALGQDLEAITNVPFKYEEVVEE
jgi:hypothetical protein